MKYIKFGVEYGAPPFFNTDVDKMGHIDFDEMGLSNDLLSRIREWDNDFQNTFDENYPPDSGFKSENDVFLHNLEGKEISVLMQKELGKDFLVEFVPLK